ncbi:hypothetical protein, partial [Burkholderia cenocepacia]
RVGTRVPYGRHGFRRAKETAFKKVKRCLRIAQFSFSRRRLGRPLRLTELHVDDRSSTHLSVDDVLSLLPGGTPCHTKVGVCMRLA